MVRRPKVLPDNASAGDVRALLADDHVHLVLVINRQGALVTTIERADIESGVDDRAPAAMLGSLRGRTVSPETSVSEAAARMQAAGRRRLAVVDDDGTLSGLLCLKRSGRGFCSDADVQSRRALAS